MSIFDCVIERRGTGSVKWDFHKDASDIVPMWVADMDFAVPECAQRAVSELNSHGVYGYPMLPDEYLGSFIDWMASRFNTRYEQAWVVPVQSVLSAIAVALDAVSRGRDGVVIQPPVYYPFFHLLEWHGRTIVENRLVRDETGRFRIDFDQLAKKLTEKSSALLLCSPHNPVGRVWEIEELDQLLDLAAARGFRIIVDEIHQDLVLCGYTQQPLIARWFARGGKAEGCPVIAVTAATKSFNLAGLSCGFLVAPDPALRGEIQSGIRRRFIGMLNPLAVAATIAAYRDGAWWLDELVAYLNESRKAVREAADARGLGSIYPRLEGTYLLWFDLRRLGADVHQRAIDEARVRLSDGTPFGAPGFLRMNIAAPRKRVLASAERFFACVAGSAARVDSDRGRVLGDRVTPAVNSGKVDSGGRPG